MTSIADAPTPIIVAQSNPDLAPSLIMVRLTGPTGTESMNPLRKPVSAARRRGCCSNMSMIYATILLVFLLLDVTTDLPGNTRTNEPVEKAESEHDRKHNRKNQSPQDEAQIGRAHL